MNPYNDHAAIAAHIRELHDIIRAMQERMDTTKDLLVWGDLAEHLSKLIDLVEDYELRRDRISNGE